MTLDQILVEGDVTLSRLGRSPWVHIVAECPFFVTPAERAGVRPVPAGWTFCIRPRYQHAAPPAKLTRAEFNAKPCPKCMRRFAVQRGVSGV